MTRAAFNHNGTLLATAGADKTVRIWKVEISVIGNPQRKVDEGDTVNACAFSPPDGSLLVWGAANRVVKVFNGDGTQRRQELKEPSDWVYAVAIAGDNQTVAAETQDGKVFFWDVRAGAAARYHPVAGRRTHRGHAGGPKMRIAPLACLFFLCAAARGGAAGQEAGKAEAGD